MSKPDEPVGPAAGVRDREQELARTFVMLADSLVEDYDIVDLLDRLAAACVRLLGVTAAGLLLDDQHGRLGMSMVTAFDSLRQYARAQNIKLTDLAYAIVHNDFNPPFLSGEPPVS